MLLATDLATAKDFYHLKLGLELLDESPYALNFRSGATQLTLSKTSTGMSVEQTQAAWIVDASTLNLPTCARAASRFRSTTRPD